MDIGYTKKSDNHGHINMSVQSMSLNEADGDDIIIIKLHEILKADGMADKTAVVQGVLSEGVITLHCDKRTKIAEALTGSISVALEEQPSDGYAHRYEFDFVAGDGLSVAFPEYVIFAETMTVAAGKRYRVTIDDGIATFASVALPEETTE